MPNINTEDDQITIEVYALPSESDCTLNVRKDDQEDHKSESKIQKRLSLRDKVDIIKAYEITSNYHKVGVIFKRSAWTIRNIVKNKEMILQMYKYYPRRPPPSASAVKSFNLKDIERSKRIAFLNKAVYEWFLRARRNRNISLITYRLIKNTALAVNKILDIENFEPNAGWVLNFIKIFKITADSMKFVPNDPGSTNLDIPSIVQFVKEREGLQPNNTHPIVEIVKEREEQQSNNTLTASTTTQNYSKNDSVSMPTRNEDLQASGTHDAASPSSELNSDEALEPIDSIKIECTECGYENNEGNDSSQHSTISNYDQALQHLKPLEDFALINEEYRVIGLLSQIEAILKAKKKEHS